MNTSSTQPSSNGQSIATRIPRASNPLVKWIALPLICLLCSAGMLRAQVVVTATVTFDVTLSIFSYSYAVTNNGSLDLAIVTFAGLPANPGTVMNLSAPTGFGATYDSGLGLISFFEDADPATPQTFAPGSTTAPFTFTSFSGPGAAQFEALDANGNSFTGPTVAPIPEPSTVSIFALSALLIFGASYRRIRQQTC